MFTSILSVISIILLVLVFLIGIFYLFCGYLAIPFYLLGVVKKVIRYPIALIEQVIYPVGVLPKIVLSGFILYFFIMGFIKLVKFFISIRNK